MAVPFVRQRHCWFLALPRLICVGAVALLLLVVIVRWPTSLPRLLAEAFGTTLAVIGIVQLAWLALWLTEQRW